MNVAVVSDFVDPENWGGAAVVAVEQVKALQENGHRAALLAPSDSGMQISDITHYHWRRRPGLSGVWSLRRHIANAIGEVKPELLLLHQPLSGLMAQRTFPHLRFRYFFHSSWPQEAQSLGRRRGLWLRNRVESAVLKRVERVYVTSAFTRDVLQRQHPEVNSCVCENPLAVRSPPFMADAASAAAIRKRYAVDRDHRIVAVFRRLIPRTGIDLCLKSLVRVTNVTALIGGAGEMEGELRAMADSLGLNTRVRFLGYVTDNEKVQIMQGADVTAVPSIALEGFGLSTLEAMACGCPVTVTPVGNNTALVRACDGGVIAEEVSPSAFSHALEACLSREWDRSALSARACCAFSWNRHAVALVEP